MGRFDVVKAERKVEGFDLLVTHRDEKTGIVTDRDPYILRVTGEQGGEKSKIWERPAGSGNCFNKKNEPIGRWITEERKDAKSGKIVRTGRLDPDAVHVVFEKPLTKDQVLSKEVTESRSKIAELEKELAAIKAEKSGTKKDQKGS